RGCWPSWTRSAWGWRNARKGSCSISPGRTGGMRRPSPITRAPPTGSILQRRRRRRVPRGGGARAFAKPRWRGGVRGGEVNGGEGGKGGGGGGGAGAVGGGWAGARTTARGGGGWGRRRGRATRRR